MRAAFDAARSVSTIGIDGDDDGEEDLPPPLAGASFFVFPPAAGFFAAADADDDAEDAAGLWAAGFAVELLALVSDFLVLLVDFFSAMVWFGPFGSRRDCTANRATSQGA